MKKILLLVVVVLTALTLSGCKESSTRSVKSWALYYAEEAYNDDGEGSMLFAYTIEKYAIYPVADEDTDFEDYDWECYRVTFLDEFAGSYEYNVLIVFEINVFGVISEDKIIDVDIERG